MESPLFIRYLLDALRQRTLAPQPDMGEQSPQAEMPMPMQMMPRRQQTFADPLRPSPGLLGSGSAERAGQLARNRKSVIDNAVNQALGE